MIDINLLLDKCDKLNIKPLYSITNEGSNSKIDFIDNDGYLYYLSAQNISTTLRRNGILAKFFNKNPYTYYNINNYFKINNMNLELLTIPINAKSRDTMFKCKIHNEYFYKSWNEVKNGARCKYCGIEKFRDSRCNKLEDIKEIALNKYNIEILEEEYINNETKMRFICNIHKKHGVQEKSWGNIITSLHPCLYCSKEKHLRLVTKTTKEFKEQIAKVHKDKYIVIGEYKNANIKIKMYCNKCKSYFFMKPSHLLSGHGCGKCTKSIGEELIRNYLIDNNIKFTKEQRFDNCIGDSRTLPFDFYLNEYNICIEYQGEQHYQPIECFGGQVAFDKRVRYDDIKKKFCKNNSIKLICIPYWSRDNISDILDKEIKYKKGLI